MIGKWVLTITANSTLAGIMRSALEKAGCQVVQSISARDGIRLAQSRQPRLIVIDIESIEIQASELTRALKRHAATVSTLIILVGLNADETSVIDGLEAGADEFVTSPFSSPVFVSRIQAVLRRSCRFWSDTKNPIKLGGLEIVDGTREVRVNNRTVKLTPSEFEILRLLADNVGRAVSRREISRAIHGTHHSSSERAVDVQVVGLRKSLGKYGKRIETVRGVGYRMRPLEVTQKP
ncbi:response regulator [candidate division GN15 bacterium]|nr:response regulator [candidate division GN15 bacterium]